jgi:hypothetical protein
MGVSVPDPHPGAMNVAVPITPRILNHLPFSIVVHPLVKSTV